MTVSVETSSTLGELIRGVGVEFAEVFDQNKLSYSAAIHGMMAEEGNKATSLCKYLTTKAQVEHFVQKVGLGYPTVFGEGSGLPVDSRILGYKTDMTPQQIGSSISVTARAMADNDYRDKLDEFKDLSVGLELAKDRNFFNIFNTAFTAQTSLPNYIFPYGDGKPLCSTVHPRKDGGTAQSNASSTGITLTFENFDTARQALQRQLDDRGKTINVGSGKYILLVAPENLVPALEIAKSVKRPGTGNNNVNVYDGDVTVISTKWIGASDDGITSGAATTAWFVIDPMLAKLIALMRLDTQFHRFQNGQTLDMTFGAYMRYCVGFTDWRGVWGSKGDGAAYSS